MHSGPRAVEGLILLLLQQMNYQKSSEDIYIVAEFKAKPFQQIALKHRPYYRPSFSKSSSCTPECCWDWLPHKGWSQPSTWKLYFLLHLILRLNHKKCRYKQRFDQSLMNTADHLSSLVLGDACATTQTSDMQTHRSEALCPGANWLLKSVTASLSYNWRSGYLLQK